MITYMEACKIVLCSEVGMITYILAFENFMISGWPRTRSLWLCVVGNLEGLAPGLLIG